MILNKIKSKNEIEVEGNLMQKSDIVILVKDKSRKEEAVSLSKRAGLFMTEDESDTLNAANILLYEKKDLKLIGEGLEMEGDFSRMIKRVTKNRWQHELLVKAAKINGLNTDEESERPVLMDCTAGLGEDSLLLAASGFQVDMYERNPIISALLKDALRRAKKVPELREIVTRMHLHEEDSIEAIGKLIKTPDVIYLDPMFPGREKSALIKKKFQLIHMLEKPADDEKELLSAVTGAGPDKIVIKRPPKGPYLADVKPSYSIEGKAVRFDCIACR